MKQLSLSIPKPCHENWAAMTPEDKGRFCGACQKTVIDFTAMSDRELAQFFKKPAGSVCGRFDNSQLNRVVDVPRKRLPWIKYFFGIALPALLFSRKAAAQGGVRQTMGRVDPAAAVCKKPLPETVAGKRKELRTDTVQPEPLRMGFVSSKMKVMAARIFKSQITNANGEPVPFASVMASEEGRAVAADSLGMFSITYFKLPLTMEVSSIGYQRQTVVYNGEERSSIVLQQADHSDTMLGVVAVKSVRKKKVAAEMAIPKKAETSPAKFSVYPNPVNANGTLTIDPKGLEAGRYKVAVVAGAGNAVQSGTVVFDKQKTKQTITLQSLPAGVYFVHLSNGAGTMSFTEKIVVQ